MTADDGWGLRGMTRGETDPGLPTFSLSTGRPLLPGRSVLTPSLETTTSSRQAAPVAIASSSVRGPFVVVGSTTRGP
jgi:hypothetical protein